MITSAYFRETQVYSYDDIVKELGLSRADTNIVLQKLLRNNIISIHKDELDFFFWTTPNDAFESSLYSFDYVGIIDLVLPCQELVLKCYPKFFEKQPNILAMKTIISALRKYKAENTDVNIADEIKDTSVSYNPLATVLFLLQDYFENGIYFNTHDVLSYCGQNEIDWNTTIDQIHPFIQDGYPCYFEYYTNETESDTSSYITRLHQCILTECSKHLRICELDILFGIDTVELYDGELIDFGDRTFIKEQILKEMNVQFNTRKLHLLRALLDYVCNENLSADSYNLSFWGSNSFNLVWEKACSDVFDSKLDKRISQLGVSLPPYWQSRNKETLRGIIKKPIWTHYDTGQTVETETLRPDYVSVISNSDFGLFVIFDAKYYNIKINNGYFRGVPGLGDIDKQQLYELAYREFINALGFSVVNAFLFPIDSPQSSIAGKVEMPILKDLSLSPIQLILLDALNVFSKYVSGKKIDTTSFLEMLPFYRELFLRYQSGENNETVS